MARKKCGGCKTPNKSKKVVRVKAHKRPKPRKCK